MIEVRLAKGDQTVVEEQHTIGPTHLGVYVQECRPGTES